MSVPAPSARPKLPDSSESPCIKICQLDLDNICRGCGRTIDEITTWSSMSQAERIDVNRRLRFSGHER